MKYTEIRMISTESLRELCIDNDWYTSGTSEEYAKLLQTARECGEATTEVIAELAEDIITHTEKLQPDDITSVMWDIARICRTFFYEVGE